METFSGCSALLPRLHLLVRLFPGRCGTRRTRAAWRGCRPALATAATGTPRPSTRRCTWLTADEDILARAANCFCKHGMEFGYARLRGVSPHGYTLFMAAEKHLHRRAGDRPQ